jgi:hypothetical protein
VYQAICVYYVINYCIDFVSRSTLYAFRNHVVTQFVATRLKKMVCMAQETHFTPSLPYSAVSLKAYKKMFLMALKFHHISILCLSLQSVCMQSSYCSALCNSRLHMDVQNAKRNNQQMFVLVAT